ncbi:SGNH/GDSL hydrolase family protein [Streptomyces lavendulocolor]|uniref:SGNH/GDSL hydrolase family protein n=1 Tax=Streptomyces lavendulocolor TaxID=67316 RepID=UPI003C2EE310
MGRRLRRALIGSSMRLVLRGPLWNGRSAPACTGPYGPADGEGMTLLLLGDSSSVSVGALRREETVGAVLAGALVARWGGRVDVEVHARVGATTAGLARQVRAAVRREGPGVALILIGGNDVFLPGRSARRARLLGAHVERLRAAGLHVVVGTCPDIGAAPALRAWSGAVGTWRSRRLAVRQAEAALAAGAVVVSLTAPEFRSAPDELYCADGFHPSGRGYALYLERVSVAVCEAAAASRDARTAWAGEADFGGAAEAARCMVSLPGSCLLPLGRPVRGVAVRPFTPPPSAAAGVTGPSAAAGVTVPGNRRGERSPAGTVR